MKFAGIDLDTAEYVGEAPDDYVGTPPEDGPRSRIAGGKLAARGFYLFTAVLCLWVFAYGSGLFPYLGTAERDVTKAPGTSSSPGGLDMGLSTMLLFEGQTAFYEYKSTAPAGDITFDVKLISIPGYSPAMKRIKGVSQGRLEFPIAQTGLYTFRHGPATGSGYVRTAYEASWGAR